MILGVAALGWTGCDNGDDTDGGMCPDGSICLGDAGGEDAGTEDAGPEEDGGMLDQCSPMRTGAVPGAACIRGMECRDMACNPELMLSAGSVYPGSMCGDECNPLAMTDTCGDCAACSEYTYLGNLRIPNLALSADGTSAVVLDGVCRLSCEPDAASNGGCRDGYTCDVDTRVCVDACQNDNQCNLDGELEVDPAGQWTCNMTTGRCELEGTDGASAGDTCEQDTDCMDNGTCLTGDTIPDGFCTRIGCNAPGFECGEGETCSVNGLGGPSWCLPQCEVGAEDTADQLGEGGSGAGCEAGEACTWDGITMGPNGGCFQGNYNAVDTPNIGVACTDDSDCFSPFGYGTCFQPADEALNGVCVMNNCVPEQASQILPGIDTDYTICDPAANQLCVGTSPTSTICLQGCDMPSECAEGHACHTDILSSGDGVCWPTCTSDDHCSGSCLQADGEACVPDGPDGVPNSGDEVDCFCDDATPTFPDAGVADGGVADGGAADAGVADAGVDAGT
jgi:hypothetical protein